MATTIPRSELGDAIQAMYPGTVQKVTVSGTSAATSNAVTSSIVRLLSTTDCHIKFGVTPTATTNDTLLLANIPEYFAINNGEKVAAIQNAAGGTLYVTEGS